MELNEKELDYLEKHILELAEIAFKEAYCAFDNAIQTWLQVLMLFAPFFNCTSD